MIAVPDVCRSLRSTYSSGACSFFSGCSPPHGLSDQQHEAHALARQHDQFTSDPPAIPTMLHLIQQARSIRQARSVRQHGEKRVGTELLRSLQYHSAESTLRCDLGQWGDGQWRTCRKDMNRTARAVLVRAYTSACCVVPCYTRVRRTLDKHKRNGKSGLGFITAAFSTASRCCHRFGRSQHAAARLSAACCARRFDGAAGAGASPTFTPTRSRCWRR
jgi:hypothetical protein